MDEKDVLELLHMLRTTIDEASTLPLGRDKCLVDRDKCLGFIDEIDRALPSELREARNIVHDRNLHVATAKREAEDILARARADANDMLDRAKDQAVRMVSEQPILREAKQQAVIHANKAKDEINEARHQTSAYIEDTFRRAEESLAALHREVKTARENLRGTR